MFPAYHTTPPLNRSSLLLCVGREKRTHQTAEVPTRQDVGCRETRAKGLVDAVKGSMLVSLLGSA